MSSITNYLIGVICTNLAKNLGHQRMIQRPKTTWGPSKNSIRRWVPICNHSKPHVLYWLVVSNICYFGSSVEFCQSAAPVRNSLLVLKSLLRTAWLRLLWSFWRHSEWRRSGWCRFSRKSCCSQCHSPCRQVVALEETLSHTLEMVQIFILSFFCPFLVSFFFVISVLPVIFCHFSFGLSCFVIFLGHVSVISCNFLKNMENIKNYSANDRKMTKNDHASRKMQFLQPAKLSFFWSFFGHVFVIWWRFCNLSVICLSFWCNFLKNMEAYQKLFEKWQKKWQCFGKSATFATCKMTNKMRDHNSNDKQNDRQNWNDKKWKNNDRQNWNDKKKWQQKRQKNDNLNSLIFSTFASLSFF